MKNNHYIEKIRQQKPLIHAITNTVTIHDMADSLIAVGASPMMAVERREVGELQSFSQALVLNTGTLTAERVEVMLEAGRAANRHQVPIILDPVGAGATNFRSQAVHQLLAGLDITLIKGNAGEIAHLAGADWQSRGVDAGSGTADLDKAARKVARDYDCLVGLTGEVDVISDGEQVIHVTNGHALMGQITGSGDMLGHLCAAFCAVGQDDLLEAVTRAFVSFGLAGEKAGRKESVRGNASFRIALVDELFNLTDEKVEEKSQWEVIEMEKVKQVLTIAGSDSGGGAGIQADLKTFQERKVFGMSVIVAVTAQNTLGVQKAYALPPEIVQDQLDSVFADFDIQGIKTGMLVDGTYMRLVADHLKRYPDIPYVLDPVMIAKGGAALMEEGAVDSLKDTLLPLATVVTPNLPETEEILGREITTPEEMEAAARDIQALGAKNVIIKGGHLEDSQSEETNDYLLLEDGSGHWLESKRIPTENTHGTGDSFASVITSELAKGKSVLEAAQTAKDFLQAGIEQGIDVGHGHGPINHWAYRRKEGGD